MIYPQRWEVRIQRWQIFGLLSERSMITRAIRDSVWQVPGTGSVFHLRMRAASSNTVVRPYCVARGGFRINQVILRVVVHAV